MKKRLLTAAAACLLILILSGVFALSASADTEGGYYTYTVSNGGATITGVDTAISGDIEILATLGGYPGTGINNYVFEDCTSLISITIPGSVTNIGDYAFYGFQSLTIITMLPPLFGNTTIPQPVSNIQPKAELLSNK